MSEEAPEHRRVTAANLLVASGVVVAIQAFALLVTSQNKPTYNQIVNSTGYSYDPLGTTPAGSTANAFLLVAFAFALTVGLVWLLRKRMVLSFKLVIFGSVAFSSFILTLVTTDVFAFAHLPRALELPVSYGVAGLVVVLIGYTIFVKNRPWLSTVILAFVGAQVGSYFAETLPTWTAIAMPVAFSVYDIYAVFKGPLKNLIGAAPTVALVGMSIKAGEFTLGLGDVVFYTLIPSLALFQFGLVPALYTILAINLGMAVTLFLLTKRRLLPGLPIPMLLGILVLGYYLL